LLLGSLGDGVRTFIDGVRDNSLQIPAPTATIAEWPVVGPRIHSLWSQAHADLPAVVQSMQPKLGDLSRKALAMVASIGGTVLLFMVSFIIAGIVMAFGQAGARSTKSIFDRIVGTDQGEEFAKLSTATIRAVAQGVLGVAFIQALVVGVVMIIAGIPFTGVLALIVLVLGIAQIPALLVTLPVMVYIWSSGDYATVPAVSYSVLLFLAGMLDNVLKPLMLGRGVDAPMPVILLGALGGMASSGILGMFVGATLAALGYQIFMKWVAANPDTPAAPTERGTPAAG
jgi:predicted PurR-regulated permease PerM